MAAKEDMWDSGCIESYESESAAEEKVKLTSCSSSTPRNIKHTSTPLNEEIAKKTYADVCRGTPAAVSSSNNDKGDLAESAAESAADERMSLLLFCGENLKIVEESKNDGDEEVNEGSDDGKAAVAVVTPSVTSDLSAEEARDNIDECEGERPPPIPSPPGSISGQQGGQENPKAVSKYSKSRKRRDKKQQRRSVLQSIRRAREKEGDEDEDDDDVQTDDESSQKDKNKVLDKRFEIRL